MEKQKTRLKDMVDAGKVLDTKRNRKSFLGGLLGPRAVRVSGTAETECASGKPSV